VSQSPNFNTNIHHSQTTLSNGLTVVTIQMPHVHVAEVAMFVRAGLRFENKHNNGISHFLEHMLFRGNQKFHNSIALNREFEVIGRELRASTLTEYTYYGFNPHISKLERGIEIFADFFNQPTFPDIELERQIILEEQLEEMNSDGVNVDIDNQACELLYPGSSLAWPTIGNEKTIGLIDKKMLEEYFETYYCPGNMILSVAGPILHEDIVAYTEKYFSQIPVRGKTISPNYFVGTLNENQVRPAFRFQYDADSQVQMQICFRAYSYNHPDYYAICLIQRIFDDGITSRLQQALREDRGLAYAVECRATSSSDTGTLDFDVCVSVEKLIEVCQVIFREINTFLHEGPSSEELEHVKQRYYYELDFDLDDPYKQNLRYGFTKLYSEDVGPEEEWKRVGAITTEKIWDVAKRILLSEKLNVIVVGPYTEVVKEKIERIVNAY